jgi:polysaccharide export outer membrane protein
LEIANLTVAEAEEKLRSVFSEKYLVNPRLTLSVVTAQSSNVVLLGEVKTPGVHPVAFGESITLLQAIARAGGFTGLASVNRVSVIRSVDGKETSIRARVSRMISGDEPDMPLLPNDVIMVPQVVF